MAGGQGGDIMSGLREVNGVQLLAAEVGATNVKALRELMDEVRSKLPLGVACLAARADGKAPLILYVSKNLIQPVAAEIGGSGGGRPDLAQADGDDPTGIPRAFARLEELFKC